MTLFYVSKEAVKWEEMCRNMGMTAEQIEEKYPRRVILDAEPHGEILQTIDAGSWFEVRDKVDESELVRIENQGWFA